MARKREQQEEQVLGGPLQYSGREGEMDQAGEQDETEAQAADTEEAAYNTRTEIAEALSLAFL